MTAPRYRFFRNGETLFDHLEEIFNRAEREILIHLYAFHNDSAGLRFVRILGAAAARGVKVRLIFDAVGSWGDREDLVRRLEAAGVEARIYRSARRFLFRRPFSFLYRNHARLILVDRKHFGFGGIGIGEIYEKRKDVFAFLEITDSLRPLEIFNRFWSLAYEPGGAIAKSVHGRPLVPGVELLLSGPAPEDAEIYRWLLERIRAARKRVVMVTTWFLPTQEMLRELSRAKSRGAEVVLVTPLQTDREHYDGFRALPISALLSDKVRWYGIPDYFHGKYVIVDDAWTVGSANLDLLSFVRNYELNITGEGGEVLEELLRDFHALIHGAAHRRRHPVPFFFRWLHAILYDLLEYLFTPGLFPRRREERAVGREAAVSG